MSSLSSKLEGDSLTLECERQVQQLHGLFVSWFQGKREKDNITTELKRRLEPDFAHVAPNGQVLKGRSALLSQLDDKYGCYRDRVFQIDIYNTKLQWHDNNKCLVTYEEWQSWQQQPTASTPSNDGSGVVLHQFGRVSTALLINKASRWRWVHVHETWLEAEGPSNASQPTLASDAGTVDNETVVTGPVEAPRSLLSTTAQQGVHNGHLSAWQPSATASVQRKLLVLVSRQNSSREQTAFQDQTDAILRAHRLPYTTIDGSDPDQRTTRNTLFGLSNLWGSYPQIFVVSMDKETPVFWGDKSRLFASNEAGTLRRDLGFVGPPEESDALGPGHMTSLLSGAVPVSEDKVPDKGKNDDGDHTRGQPHEIKFQPRRTHGSKLLVLYCSRSDYKDQFLAQEEAMTVLALNNLSFERIDGTDVANRDKRDELFQVSQEWGSYPQFFFEDLYGETVFWGGLQPFFDAFKRGILKEELGLPESAKVDEDDATTGAQSAEALQGRDHVLVMVSSQALSPQHMATQNKVTAILTAKKIPFTEVDGSDPHNRVQRNRLFGLSKRWGAYPQFFVVKADGDTSFWGFQEAFFISNEAGTLKEDFGIDIQEKQKRSMDAAVTAGAVAGATVAATAATLAKQEQSENSAMSTNAVAKGDQVSDTDSYSGYNAKELKREIVIAPEDASMECAEIEEDDLFEAEASIAKEVDSEKEEEFMQESQGILVFEEETALNEVDDALEEPSTDGTPAGSSISKLAAVASPIPNDTSKKRHVSTVLEKYAKPLTWEKALVGLSIAGFDIGTSQGPIGDEAWYKEMGDSLEEMAQSRAFPRPRRKIGLPEMVFPAAHVALEGHGLWLSWDVLDVLEEWAVAHQDIAIRSSIGSRGVAVMKSKDASLWAAKKYHGDEGNTVASIFHYDWTFSTPFCGKVEGGEWTELDSSGMRTELLTDTSIPILFFDEIILFEDDLHDNGQVEFSVKLRVMPSCAYVLARLWLRVDNVVVRIRETRLLVDFFGIKPKIFRDVTWRECYWGELGAHGLPTDVRSWHYEGNETPQWNALVRNIPEVAVPNDIYKHAVLEAN